MPEKRGWSDVSAEAKALVKWLLEVVLTIYIYTFLSAGPCSPRPSSHPPLCKQVDPRKRCTADEALATPWLARAKPVYPDAPPAAASPPASPAAPAAAGLAVFPGSPAAAAAVPASPPASPPRGRRTETC